MKTLCQKHLCLIVPFVFRRIGEYISLELFYDLIVIILLCFVLHVIILDVTEKRV